MVVGPNLQRKERLDVVGESRTVDLVRALALRERKHVDEFGPTVGHDPPQPDQVLCLVPEPILVPGDVQQLLDIQEALVDIVVPRYDPSVAYLPKQGPATCPVRHVVMLQHAHRPFEQRNEPTWTREASAVSLSSRVLS